MKMKFLECSISVLLLAVIGCGTSNDEAAGTATDNGTGTGWNAGTGTGAVIPGTDSGMSTGYATGTTTGYATGTATGYATATTTGTSTTMGTGTGTGYDTGVATGTGYSTGTGTGTGPATGTGTSTATSTGMSTGSDTGMATGSDTGTATGSDTGTATGSDTGTGTSSDTGTGTSSDTGTGTGPDTGTGTGSDTDTGTGSDTDTGTGTGTVDTDTGTGTGTTEGVRPRVIVTSDGEIDDQCSMVRFLLHSNDFDVEGIIKTSSMYHWQGHKWAGDYWEKEIYEAYATVHSNLVKHDPNYPTVAYLNSITKLGNVSDNAEMTLETDGSNHIVDVLLDETDDRPIWLQAWGGTNSIARALKTIEEKHPDKMAAVAKKCRFFFIWEQDGTFQKYIRNSWTKPFNIPTIISDQFITFGYWWQRWTMPSEPDSYFRSTWMKANIFKSSNALIEYYRGRTHDKLGGKEDFIGEGDSPSFIHEIPTGLRSTESPDWGGWGGRYVHVRESTWLDKVPVNGYSYPSGRWYTNTAWGRQNYDSAPQNQLEEYFKPITRWVGAIQNDFAARVDWCDKSYGEANHQPVVKLAHGLDLKAKPGATVSLSANGTTDPDGDTLTYKWWQYEEADTYDGKVQISNSGQQNASFVVPAGAQTGKTIHIVCEVEDNGSPPLTRYQRVVVEVE